MTKTFFIKSFILATIWASFVVVLDIVLGYLMPESFLYKNLFALNARALIFSLDFLGCFMLILIVLLSRIFLGSTIVFLLLSIMGIFYLVNWATFLVVGQFLGLEGLRFCYHNFGHLLWLISKISPSYLVVLLIIFTSPLWIIVLARITKKYCGLHIQTLKNIHKLLFNGSVLIVILAMMLLLPACYDKKMLPSIFRALRFQSSPQLALFFDRRWPAEKIKYEAGMPKLVTNWKKQISWNEYKASNQNDLPSTPVVLIVIESLRGDILDNPEIMPNLSQLKNTSTVTKVYSSSNVTDYAWPSIFTAQYPLRSRYHYYHPQKVDYPRVTIHDVLKHFNYSTGIFSAQNENWGGMNNVLNTASADIFFASETKSSHQYSPAQDTSFAAFVKRFGVAGKIDDGVVTDTAIKWFSEQKKPRFFAAINFQRSHFPYTWPESFQPPYPSAEPEKWLYPRNKVQDMRFRYFNSLRYVDKQIGKIIEQLKAQGLFEKTLIIVTGDHGEAFYEHWGTCHGNELFNETAQTVAIIKNSSDLPAISINKTPELIDLAPTILKILGLPPHPAFQGRSMDDNPSVKRPIFITVNSVIADQDAIILEGWKLIKDYREHRQYLFNLDTDPYERKNLLNSYPLQARTLEYLLSTWRNQQLKYYSNSSLQKKYYAPDFFIE